MLMVGVSFGLSGRHPAAPWWVVVWFALNWFGDNLDGTLGRVAAIGMAIAAVIPVAEHVRALYAAEPLMAHVPAEMLHDISDHALGVAKEH